MHIIFLNIIVLFFFANCNRNEKDLILEEQDVVNSERIMITDKNFIIQKNLMFGTEYYDSYLFFYTRDFEFQCSEPCPGKIFEIYNDSLVGGYNQYKFSPVFKKLDNQILINFSIKSPDIVKEKQDSLYSIKIHEDSIVLNDKKYQINDIVFSSIYKKQIEHYTLSSDTLCSNIYIMDTVQRKLIYDLIWSVILKSKISKD